MASKSGIADTQVTKAAESLPTAAKVSIIVSAGVQTAAGKWKGAMRAFLLASALQKLGHPVEILGFVDSSDETFSADIPVKAQVSGTYPQFFKSAWQLISKIEGDIVYASKPKPSSFGTALLSRLRDSRRPVILDIDDWELSWHGGDNRRYPESWKQVARDLLKPDGALRQPDHPLYLRWAERWVSKADAITMHTKFLHDRFGGHYVPNGKDTELFDPSRYNPEESRAKYGLSDYKVLMFPGAPRPYKGIEDLLSALELLDQPDYRLVIVGGSPYDDYDQTLMSRWGKWIIQLPQCTYEEMPEVVSAAHVVVVPQRDTFSTQAQFPLKLTDGMAMAKPVLATRVGDIPDILADTGYLVDADSPEQLAQGLKQILTDLPTAELKGRQARTRCIERYSIEAMATQLAPVMAKMTAAIGGQFKPSNLAR